MKGALSQAGEAVGGQLISVALSLAAVGVVGLLVWRKIFGAQSVSAVVDNVVKSSGDIARGLPGLISDTVTGANDSTYISQEQQRALAAAALASHGIAG